MSTGKAVEALAPLLKDSLRVKRLRDGKYRIYVRRSKLPAVDKTPGHTLAALAFIAQARPDAEGIRVRVGWHGPVPSRGMSAWEESALGWLAKDPATKTTKRRRVR